ncbi:hypothetical protein [Acinetobacter baumannii]|uniref:hypothetical protein n=2 Tax=Acinetobacter baumannii TaxID=470 RepID=UPI00280DB035|nr:hypothetical protein [Acinetobacter baumannii]MDQ9112775.1 hypothetical protein [Acinetobacter baumannii]MDT7992848.1 hypothetical protein [Acinetobacter baumannii]MDW7583780.1 hypothetical protein [Acinetobacter baumannii]
MAQPYNYMLDIPNPSEAVSRSLMQGFNMAANIDQAQMLREQRAAQQAQQEQMQRDIDETVTNPTYETIGKLQIKYPQYHEAFKNAWGTINEGEKQSIGSIASQGFAALDNNKPEVSVDLLERAAVGYDNVGQKKNADIARGYIKMIRENPSAAKMSLGQLWLAADENGFKTYSEQKRANEKQPYELNQIAANTAKTVAETNDIPLAAEDRRTGVENQGRKIEYDNQYNYDKLSQDQQQFYDGLDKTERIEAAKLRAAKAESSIQRVERLEKVENYANAAKQAADASNLAARLTQQAKENSGPYWDRLVRQIPGTSENTFAKDIETLKSQVFLAQVEKMRGLGALTDKEGDAIRSSIASLDINQGPEAVQKNLSKIAQQMSAAAKSANRKAQLYATKGQGYSPAVIEAAKTLGISPAEAQKFVNENGL